MGLFHRKKRPEAPPLERLLSYQAANLQHIGTRERQEDAFAFANALDVTEIRRKGLMAAVADGMGGMKDGKLVSESCIAGILSDFQRMDREDDLAAQLLESVLMTNERLFGQFQGEGGTTLVAALVYREDLYWASVGDSYLYLKRGPGLYRLNRNQNYRSKLYLEAIRSGILDPSEADRDPDGPRLSEFMGSEELAEVDRNLRPLRLMDGDSLLLCSDGVGGVLREPDLLECLSAASAQEACGKLDARIRALDRSGQDNYTALVVRCAY